MRRARFAWFQPEEKRSQLIWPRSSRLFRGMFTTALTTKAATVSAAAAAAQTVRTPATAIAMTRRAAISGAPRKLSMSAGCGARRLISRMVCVAASVEATCSVGITITLKARNVPVLTKLAMATSAIAIAHGDQGSVTTRG